MCLACQSELRKKPTRSRQARACSGRFPVHESCISNRFLAISASRRITPADLRKDRKIFRILRFCRSHRRFPDYYELPVSLVRRFAKLAHSLFSLFYPLHLFPPTIYSTFSGSSRQIYSVGTLIPYRYSKLGTRRGRLVQMAQILIKKFFSPAIYCER